jgi:hypothetical protein
MAAYQKRQTIFTTVHSEGAILPMDLLRRISDPQNAQLDGLTPEAYHLSTSKLNETINRAWTNLLGAWQRFQNGNARLAAHDTGTTLTRERWLLPLFQELGYSWLQTKPAIAIGERSYPISHGWEHVPIHLVSYKNDLDRSQHNEHGTRRTSPHSLLQEILNRSSAHLWGIVANGLRLRILRNNVSLTRQAYVEFDLEAMFSNQIYADFVLLWLLCHQSRVEGARPEECWLEKWSREAHATGTRALDDLRRNVELAISELGSGFLSHPANGRLREKLHMGTLSTMNYYNQLLRLVYRLLVLFVAEDRGILFDPNAPPAACEIYKEYYSTSKLRYQADRQLGTRHSDLYYGLKLVMEKLGQDSGCPELGLPALNGFLFSSEAIADLNDCQLANYALLAAVRHLAYTESGRTRRIIDYKNLGSEELGSVYESLLELHPIFHLESGTFELASASGNERKTSGSYYTPTSLITCLLDSALDPVLKEAENLATVEEAEAAILNLKICDPACGSGHFLVAAAHRVAKRLAAVRTGDEEPAPEARRTALRDVVGRCIYGVDINPMAVELCKVSLWMEAIEPGKPLSFLDAHIQHGNSLLGATPALLKQGIPDSAFEPIEGDEKKICSEFKKKNKARHAGQLSLFNQNLQPWNQLGNLATSRLQLDDMPDDTVEAVRHKQKYYSQLVQSSGYLFGRLWADAWCAAFVWKKTKEFAYPITEETFRDIEKNPHSIAVWMHEEIIRLAEQYRFFHWHLAFPDVFRVPTEDETPDNEQTGWSGGFDVVLGNPPWEKIKLQEKEWFAARRPDIANAANAAQRKRMIEALAREDTNLHAAFLDDLRQAAGESHLIRHTERYPLCGRGDVNTYAIFAESMRSILRSTGRAGCIVPSGIATDDTTKFFFQNLMETRSLASLYDFENREGIFAAVHRSYKFCLLTLTGSSRPATKGADFVFFAHQVENVQEKERRFTLSASDIRLLNPNTRTCPIFRSQHDANLTRSIYHRLPILIKRSSQEKNPWNIKLSTMFHMTNDASLLHPRNYLEKAGLRLVGNVFENAIDRYIPLYEGRLGHQFNHRFANQPSGQLQDVSIDQLIDPNFSVEPQYWVHIEDAKHHLQRHSILCTTGLLGFRRISRNTDERTSIASIIPWGAASYGWILVLGPKATDLLLLLGTFNSFPFDYLLRNALSQPSIPQGTFEQIPCPSPEFFDPSLKKILHPNLLELTYTAWDLEAFAKDCGYDGPPFKWDEERRFLLRCELDAAYFHLYGIARDDVDYIMETFPVVKRKDEKQYGEYRTKRVIMEMYDEMQRAMETGGVYEMRLVPRPGDVRVACEGRRGILLFSGRRGAVQKSDIHLWHRTFL